MKVGTPQNAPRAGPPSATATRGNSASANSSEAIREPCFAGVAQPGAVFPLVMFGHGGATKPWSDRSTRKVCEKRTASAPLLLVRMEVSQTAVPPAPEADQRHAVPAA